MKKILLILTVLVLSPLATQAENALNTDEAFQMARVFKLGRESANSGFQGKTGLWKSRKEKSMHIVCPNGQYYRTSSTPKQCVSMCTGVTCDDGTHPQVKNDRCCCE